MRRVFADRIRYELTKLMKATTPLRLTPQNLAKLSFWGAVASLTILLFVRSCSHIFFDYDSIVLLECAQRWANGKGLTTSLVVHHPQDISAEPQHPLLRWWAPGIALVIGLLLKTGLSLEAAAKIGYLVPVFLGWLGWLLLIQKHILAQSQIQWYHTIIVIFAPLLLILPLDLDENTLWACIPWAGMIASRFVGTHLFRSCFLYGLLCGIAVVFCHQSYVLVLAGGIVLLSLNKSLLTKVTAGSVLLAPVVLTRIPLSLFGFATPEYLKVAPSHLMHLAQNIYQIFEHLGIKPLIGLLGIAFPNSILLPIDQLTQQIPYLGYFTTALLVLSAVACYVLYQKSKPSLSGKEHVFLYFSAVFYGYLLQLFLLTIICGYNYYFLNFLQYYRNLSALTLFLFLFLTLQILNKTPSLRKLSNGICTITAVYVVVWLVTGLVQEYSDLKTRVVGYSYPGQEELRYRKSLAEIRPGDLNLPINQIPKNAIVYSYVSSYLSIKYPDAHFSIRPFPTKTQWRNSYTSKELVLYFITENADSITANYFINKFQGVPDEELYLTKEFQRMPELSLLNARLPFNNKHCLLFRARLPNGWRGESLFAEETTSP